MPTTKGLSDLFVSWKYFTQHQQVIFNATDSSFAGVAHTAQQGIVPYLIADPSVGLFSATDTNKGGVLQHEGRGRPFRDGDRPRRWDRT